MRLSSPKALGDTTAPGGKTTWPALSCVPQNALLPTSRRLCGALNFLSPQP